MCVCNIKIAPLRFPARLTVQLENHFRSKDPMEVETAVRLLYHVLLYKAPRQH
jgi:hypothetical protein